MLPTKFQVNWPFSSGEEGKNRLSRWLPWWPSWISKGNELAIFDLQVTLMLPTTFRINALFGSGEAKTRFLRWQLWLPSLISDWNNFFIYKSTRCFLPSFETIGLSVQEKKQKIIFSRWLPWQPSWISNRNDFSYFNLQVTAFLPIKFCVNWPFGS